MSRRIWQGLGASDLWCRSPSRNRSLSRSLRRASLPLPVWFLLLKETAASILSLRDGCRPPRSTTSNAMAALSAGLPTDSSSPRSPRSRLPPPPQQAQRPQLATTSGAIDALTAGKPTDSSPRSQRRPRSASSASPR